MSKTAPQPAVSDPPASGLSVQVFTHPACPRCGEAVRVVWAAGEAAPGRFAYETVSLTDKAGLDAAHAAQVKTIPTLIVSVDGVEVERIVGAPGPGALETALQQTEQKSASHREPA